MRVIYYVISPVLSEGKRVTTQTHDRPEESIPYDETAVDRAYNAIQNLQKENLRPLSLVCGLRAYTSLWAYMNSIAQLASDGSCVLPDRETLYILGYGSCSEPRNILLFCDVPVTLNMNQLCGDEDLIFATTDSGGIGQMLRNKRKWTHGY